MPTFIVNSAILTQSDPKACAIGAPKALYQTNLGVSVKSCYCCSPEGRVVFVVDGSDREKVLEAFSRVNVPVASILAVEEVKPTQ